MKKTTDLEIATFAEECRKKYSFSPEEWCVFIMILMVQQYCKRNSNILKYFAGTHHQLGHQLAIDIVKNRVKK